MTELPVRKRDLMRWGACAAIVLCAHTAAGVVASRPDPVLPIEMAGAIVVELAPIHASPTTTIEDIAPGPQQVEAEASQARPAQAASKPSQNRKSAAEPKPDRPVERKPPDRPVEKEPVEKKPLALPVAQEASVPQVENKPPEKPVVKKPEPEKPVEKKPEPKRPVEKKPPNPTTVTTRAVPLPRPRSVPTKPAQASTPAPATTAPAPARRKAKTARAPSLGRDKPSRAAVRSWKRRVLVRLERRKRYPRAARRRGERGVVHLSFSIDRRGRLVARRIKRSSGSRTLDREALALARRASPFPPPPRGFGGKRIKLVVPIRFNVR